MSAAGHPKFKEREFDYDLLVIGGGSAGVSLAMRAAQAHGQKVAIVDAVQPTKPWNTQWSAFLGTCASVGCIPKKILHGLSMAKDALVDANVAWLLRPQSESDTSSTAGEDRAGNGKPMNFLQPAPWEQIMDKVRLHIRSIAWSNKSELASANITTFEAYARFRSNHEVALVQPTSKKEDEAIQAFMPPQTMPDSITATNIVIATGTRPSYEGFEDFAQYLITSDDFFVRTLPPDKTLIIGASYIATEIAGILINFGFPVTMLVRSKVLRTFDAACAEMVSDDLVCRGVTIRTGQVLARIEEEDEPSPSQKASPTRKKRVYVKSSGQNDEKILGTFDTIILAVGRTGTAQTLDLPCAGLSATVNGTITVNEQDQTSIPNIYALGDVAAWSPQLQTVAAKSGVLLANRLYADETAIINRDLIPSCIFTPLPYASLGITEEEARMRSGYSVYHTSHVPLEWALNEDRCGQQCYFKFIFEDTSDRLVAAHIVAPHAADIMQGIAYAIANNATRQSIAETLTIHPTISEAIAHLQLKDDAKTSIPQNFNC